MTDMLFYSYGVSLLILCPLIFLAAFIDSAVGGGGIIALPAYLFVGLPPHTAYGTNKFSSTAGLLAAMGNYLRGGYVDFSAAISGGVFALMGSFIGTWLALSLSTRTLQVSLMIALPIAGVLVLVRQGMRKKQVSGDSEENISKVQNFRTKMILCSLIGLVCGTYDGFFGPGAGMFMTMGLTALAHLDIVKAAGTARVINFSSNISSLATWMINGKVYFPVAIPCMICAVAGAFLGSRTAMKAGRKFLRPVLALVAIMLFIKILVDLIRI